MEKRRRTGAEGESFEIGGLAKRARRRLHSERGKKLETSKGIAERVGTEVYSEGRITTLKGES